MTFLNNWTKAEIGLVENYLVINGDLILKAGQNAIRLACKALPEDPSLMDDWCKKWLANDGKEKLFTSIKHN